MYVCVPWRICGRDVTHKLIVVNCRSRPFSHGLFFHRRYSDFTVTRYTPPFPVFCLSTYFPLSGTTAGGVGKRVGSGYEIIPLQTVLCHT